MKKTLLIIFFTLFFLFVVLLGLRSLRNRRGQRWLKFRQPTPSTQISPKPSPQITTSPISPQPTSVSTQATPLDADFAQLDSLFEGADPQSLFADDLSDL